MAGLLQKLIEIREKPASGDAFFERTQIPVEDRRELNSEIERIVSQDTLVVSEDTFSFRARRKGWIFPVLVFVTSVIVLAGSVFLFYILFSREIREREADDTLLTTSTGLVLQQFKQEAQAELEEKNREINAIQDRLSQIQSEKANIEADIEERIQAREQELQAQIDSEIEAERNRLRSQGYAEEEITRRLSQFEVEKRAEYDTALQSYRDEQEAEKARLQQDLANLESEFSQSLQQANQELSSIQDAAKQREAELQQQFEEEQSKTKAELSQAEAQLQQLSDQRDQEISLTNQLNGFYARVRDEIRAEQYDDALATLQNLKTFLDSPTLIANDAMLNRRPIDIFTADSLERLIASERKSAQTMSFAETAQVVNDIKDLATRAAALVESGDSEQAAELYRESFEKIPELAAGYEYLKSVDGLNTTDTQRAFNTNVVRALQLGTQGQGPQAILAFEQALSVLPAQYDTAEFISGFRQTVTQVATSEEVQADTTAAAPLLNQAAALMADGKFLQAADTYENALGQYPLTNERSQAAEAIRSMYRQLSSEQARAAELANQVTDLRSQVDELLGLPTVHTEESNPLFDEAAQAMDEGRYEDAIDTYETILRDYPQTDRRFDIISALRTLSDEYESAVADAADKYGAMEEQLTGALDRLSAVERALSSLSALSASMDNGDLSSTDAERGLGEFEDGAKEAGFAQLGREVRNLVTRLVNRVTQLREENASLSRTNDELKANLDNSTANQGSNNEQVQEELTRLQNELENANQAIAERDGEISQLEDYRRRLNDLSAAYQEYRTLEDENSDSGQIRTRTYLQAFAQAVGAELYPADPDDFIRRINAYNRSFEEAGVDEAFYGELIVPLQDVQSVLFDPNYAETIDSQLEDFDSRASEAEAAGEAQKAELYRTYHAFLLELKDFLADFNDLTGF